MECGNTVTVTTNWLLYGPGTGVYDPTLDPVLAPFGATRSSPGVFASGDPTCENAWCSLYVIPAGSEAGNYHLTLWTTPGEANSAATNALALRAMMGTGPTPCGSTCLPESVDESTTDFQPCSTIAEGSFLPNSQCPEIHGDKYMGIYVNSGASGLNCNPGTRSEGPSTSPATVTGNEPCANFYLAQVAPSYAGKTMNITLFDPGEGATAIRILQPDGTPASFTYQTDDTAAEDGPQGGVPYISDDGNDPPTNPVTCICDPGIQLSTVDANGTHAAPLPSRTSASKYNDRYLEIEVPITDDVATLEASGGWYKVQYVFASNSVSDRTTWSVNIGGNPIHLVG
jgi:hypothetical protein